MKEGTAPTYLIMRVVADSVNLCQAFASTFDLPTKVFLVRPIR